MLSFLLLLMEEARSMRSTAERQNLREMRSLLRFSCIYIEV